MTKFKVLGIFLMVFALIGISSCNNDDDGNMFAVSDLPYTVNGVIYANGSLTTLRSALKTASGDLPATLDGDGPFTLFAPSNGAFDALATELGFDSSADMLAKIDPTLLSTILTYHLVASEVEVDGLTEGTTLTTVMGDQLTVSVTGDGTVQLIDATKLPQTNSVANIGLTNPDATNGIVHFIDKVLLPQAAIEALKIDTRPTILDWAKSSENLTTLVSALKKTDLTETIVGLDSANVLAPTNQAFANLLESLGDDYNSLDDFDNDTEIALLTDILKYHVLPAKDGAIGLTDGPITTAFEENSINVVSTNGGFAFEDATTTSASTVTANIEAKNGFVQIIDKVLLPKAAVDFTALLATNDLAMIVVGNANLSLLEEALVATDLVDVFVDASNESFVQGDNEEDEAFEERRTPSNYTYFNPVTVFAPTDTAFENLLAALGNDYTGIDSFDTEDELALLKEILLYHVVEGKNTSNTLSAGNLTTAAGTDIEIISVLGSDTFVIGDATNDVNANINLADVPARNGVAHIIDKVLLPESAIAFISSLNSEEE